MQSSPLVRLVGISKRFSETVALEDASLEVRSGEIVGLVGPNGSGKSTLVRILGGYYPPDEGTISVSGNEVNFRTPAEAIACGIRSIAQTLEVYPTSTVLENIFIGQEIVRKLPLIRLMSWGRMRARSQELLARVGADSIDPRTLACRLSGGQQKAVALARLLAVEAKVLIFDEPAAALGVQQKARLLEVMSSEARDGHGVIFISHDVEDVLAVATRIVMLRRGRVVGNIDPSDTDVAALSLQMSTP